MKISNLIKRLIGGVSSLLLFLMVFVGEATLKLKISAGNESHSDSPGKDKLLDLLDGSKKLEILGVQRVLYWIAIVLTIALMVWFIVAIVSSAMGNKKVEAVVSKVNKLATLVLVGVVVLFLVASIIPDSDKVSGGKFSWTLTVLRSVWYWLAVIVCAGHTVLELGVVDK